ncbi:efflux RND transporter periplasmic adaptor subunit [Arcobacter lanthieri]|uniref:efflux RND transporter periplasmic adaptor subunit n=1 Tax=Aliarcobacter lanthieri TaxID=1355374 RepID=UPI0019221CCB|nr:HlyD family efflux transporter periplasmic adaptor subunit [Aliarcobacter lanthieri]MBL3519609.1 efflux RND transporter periplasmic adaptor subunit [Aliarcobacter lanthieri]
MKKFIFLIYFIAIGLSANPIDAKQLFNIEKVKVKKEFVKESKTFYGITKIDESKTTDIVSRFDGYITYLNANKNYLNIKKSETLYSIYSSEINSIQQEIQIAKELNNNIYKSAIAKLDNFSISKSEQDKIINGKLTNNGILVSSPINGVIIEKNINNNSYIQKGEILFKIASLDELWFIASVYQEDLAFLKIGMNANIRFDGIQNAISSRIDFIYPVFNEDTKTVDIRFIVPNKNLNLLPSMFGKVEIYKDKLEVLTLPTTAVIKKEDKFYVFIPKENGEFEPKIIEVKRISSDKYEVLSGLNQDDEVINNSLFLYDADAMTNRLYDIKSPDEW